MLHMPKAFAALGAPAGRTYVNPIVPGDHPDAGAIRVGDDYYLTHSSFRYTPGLVIWHSKNLVDWKPVGAALSRYIGDVWAPYLCEHEGQFFIYFPVDGELYVVHAASPVGPWSEPVDLKIKGIDPCHFEFLGRRILYFAGGKMVTLAADGLSVTSEPKKVFGAWPIPEGWRVECECLEAPKVSVKNGYIYLTVAEGGTSGPASSHMVVSMRSRSPEGPWEFSPYNPILHTASREDFWWSVGHGRLVEATDGSWWMTCHAYRNHLRTLGRENLLVPVEWTADGWYRVPADITKNAPLAAPPGPAGAGYPNPSDSFSGKGLGLQWQFWKGYDRTRFKVGDGSLELTAQGTSAADSSVLTCMAVDTSYTVEVDVEVRGGCQAGLLLFYSGEHATGLAVRSEELTFLRNGSIRRMGAQGGRMTLRLVNDRQEMDAYFRLPGQRWTHVPFGVDVEDYNQNILGGFLDLRPALLACGSGTAVFRNFRYIAEAVNPLT